MKTNNILKMAGLTLAISALAACQAGAVTTIAYNNPASLTTAYYAGAQQGLPGNIGAGPFVYGMEFTVNSAISIDALGAYNYAGNSGGFVGPVDVAIYNVASQTVVGGVLAFAGTTSSGLGANGSSFVVGSSRFANVNPFTLGAGTYMIVVSGLGTATDPGFNFGYYPDVYGDPRSNPMTEDSGGGLLSFGGNYYSAGSTLGFPGSYDGAGAPRYGAGTFEFTAVPEVENFAIAGVGMLGLIFIGRKAVTKAVAKAV